MIYRIIVKDFIMACTHDFEEAVFALNVLHACGLHDSRIEEEFVYEKGAE